MYDIKWIRDNAAAFDLGLQRRGVAPQAQELLELDDARRKLVTQIQNLRERHKRASAEIGKAKKNKDEALVQSLMPDVAKLKADIAKLEIEELKDQRRRFTALAAIPNLPLEEVPDGKDASDNIEYHRFSAKRDYSFAPKQHFELGEALGFMDFESAAKLSGARFVVLKAGLARFERALAQFMLDLHTTEHGYTEVSPPLLVRDPAMYGTAQLPKFAEDQFESDNVIFSASSEEFNFNKDFNLDHPYGSPFIFNDREREKEYQAALNRDHAYWSLRQTELWNPNALNVLQRLWLIPTAEVPLTNLVRESILDEAELPLRFTACTPCFRAEAGAAGKDTRGMIRQHQFTKVELVSITTPEASRDEHERMLSCAEEVLRRLDLHYRVVTLCAGDMGFAAQKTYDIEVWLPGQGMYREISSCSVCGEFQARRMNARFRAKGGSPRHVHTLNGSGVAVGRALIAVMETYQQGNGSISVPDALRPYMGGATSIGEEA
ncbi:MAG: seryl-tRNA synthetase [Alphaproteobacteria bacterium]|jgi:seryl-tRNA synthetase|nr:seryl-tRNA synthetase [Alphaproteobacteria bacterium]